MSIHRHLTNVVTFVSLGVSQYLRVHVRRLAVELREGTAQEAANAPRCYLVANNVDGAGLRTPEAQALLAELVSTGVVHLVASIDHINAPLLWDKKAATRLNWCAAHVGFGPTPPLSPPPTPTSLPLTTCSLLSPSSHV